MENESLYWEIHTLKIGLVQIQSENLNISLNSEVRTVKLTGEKIQLELKNGTQLTSDKLVLTSLSSIETIEFEDGTSISPKTKQV